MKFNEPSFVSRGSTRHSRTAAILIKLGLAEDNEGAAKVLLVSTVIFILIAFSVPFLFSSESLPDDGKGLEVAGPQS